MARYVRRRVLWGPGGTDITKYVIGDIVIRKAARELTASCEIPVSTALLAYFAVGSLAAPADLEVWVYVTEDGSTTSARLFNGRCEAPRNTGLLVPSGSISGAFSALANTPGCLLVGADSGYTRVDLIASFATAAGAIYGTLDSDRLASSRAPLKPIDLQGITTADLINRWQGGIDGWEARLVDAGVELIPLDEIAGPAITTVRDFTPADYFSLGENAPSRPATQYVLGGQTISIPDGEQTPVVETDETGTTTTTTTYADGVIVSIGKEREESYSPKGVTVSPAVTQVIQRDTVTCTYEASGGHNTPRLLTRTTVTEAFYAPFAANDSYYTFRDGTFRSETIETFREVGRIKETFEWDLVKCYVKVYRMTRSGWLAPLSETADAPHQFSPDVIYSDPGVRWEVKGETRVQDAEEYIEVESRLVGERYYPLGGGEAWTYAGQLVSDSHPYAWRARVEQTRRWGTNLGGTWMYPRVSSHTLTTWKENKDGNRHEERKLTFRLSKHKFYDLATDALISEVEYGQLAVNETRTKEGPIPPPEQKSPTQRAYELDPFIETYSAPGNFDAVTRSYFSELFEDSGEALRTARWDARRATADEAVISHPGDVSILEWDPVTVTDPARNLDEAPGWIHAIEYRLGSAGFNQTTTVKIDPDPGADPMETT